MCGVGSRLSTIMVEKGCVTLHQISDISVNNMFLTLTSFCYRFSAQNLLIMLR